MKRTTIKGMCFLILFAASFNISAAESVSKQISKDGNINSIINSAGQYPLHFIINNAKKVYGKILVASKDHPVRIRYTRIKGEQSWPHQSEQPDKWNPCLIGA